MGLPIDIIPIVPSIIQLNHPVINSSSLSNSNHSNLFSTDQSTSTSTSQSSTSTSPTSVPNLIDLSTFSTSPSNSILETQTSTSMTASTNPIQSFSNWRELASLDNSTLRERTRRSIELSRDYNYARTQIENEEMNPLLSNNSNLSGERNESNISISTSIPSQSSESIDTIPSTSSSLNRNRHRDFNSLHPRGGNIRSNNNNTILTSSPFSRRLSNSNNNINLNAVSSSVSETDAILNSTRLALNTAIGFAERLEQMTRTLSGISASIGAPVSINNDYVSASLDDLSLPSSSFPSSTVNSNTIESETTATDTRRLLARQLTPLQRSLDQLRIASDRIERILTEERIRALNLGRLLDSANVTSNSNPSIITDSSLVQPILDIRNTSETIRLLRETSDALLNELSSIPSSITPATTTSIPTIPTSTPQPMYFNLRNLGQASFEPFIWNSNNRDTSNLNNENLNNNGSNGSTTTNRRRAVYQIVIARNNNNSVNVSESNNNLPEGRIGSNNSNESTTNEVEREKFLRRGFMKLDRNGDEISLEDVDKNVHDGTNNNDIEKKGRVGR